MTTRVDTRSKRVLVVCGSQWSRSLLRAQLPRAGFTTIGAATLEMALSYGAEPEAQPLHLVIVDWESLVMARGFGAKSATELIRRLRVMHPKIRNLALCSRGQSPPGSWDMVMHRPQPLTDVIAPVNDILEPSPA